MRRPDLVLVPGLGVGTMREEHLEDFSVMIGAITGKSNTAQRSTAFVVRDFGFRPVLK